MKVKLLVSRSGPTQSHNAGDEIDVDAAEAKRLFESNPPQAIPAEGKKAAKLAINVHNSSVEVRRLDADVAEKKQRASETEAKLAALEREGDNLSHELETEMLVLASAEAELAEAIIAETEAHSNADAADKVKAVTAVKSNKVAK